MVSMAVRDDHEIDLLQIDAQRLHIVFEDLGVVAGIEQDVLAAIIDQGGETPVQRNSGVLPERVVKNGDPIRRFCGAEPHEQPNPNREGPERNPAGHTFLLT